MFVESHDLLYAYLFQIQQKNDVKNTLREERYFLKYVHTRARLLRCFRFNAKLMLNTMLNILI